jgi:hypothetical protein
MTLLPGDVLLYKPKGIFGWAIRVKTWHPISHVEIAMLPGFSAASRDGEGVDYYRTRLEGLVHVLRPSVPFDLTGARQYVSAMLHTPYGWKDLLCFYGMQIDAPGIVCSPFVTEVLRASGVPVFNHEPANLIAPCDFLKSELLEDVTAAVTATT